MSRDALLDDLRYRGEGTDLDFKAERYPFALSTPEQKSELLKDILAMANGSRDGTAHILLGFKEDPPNPPIVVGLPDEGAIDDSRLQEFINSKTNTKLDFRYEERVFEGKRVGVISIPKQRRPFYLPKAHPGLEPNVVYVRRGSSTGRASPDEIARMGEVDNVRAEATVELMLETLDNAPWPQTFDREFLVFPEELPDYQLRTDDSGMQIHIANRDYYRDSAEFLSCERRGVEIRVALENRSPFALTDVRLEVRCRAVEEGGSVELICFEDMPEKPQSSRMIHDIPRSVYAPRVRPRVNVDARGGEQVMRIDLGTIRPGEKATADDDAVVLPGQPGAYRLTVRTLANELPTPLTHLREFRVDGPVSPCRVKEVRKMMLSYLDVD